MGRRDGEDRQRVMAEIGHASPHHDQLWGESFYFSSPYLTLTNHSQPDGPSRILASTLVLLVIIVPFHYAVQPPLPSELGARWI
jgi:hypothetical protein